MYPIAVYTDTRHLHVPYTLRHDTLTLNAYNIAYLPPVAIIAFGLMSFFLTIFAMSSVIRLLDASRNCCTSFDPTSAPRSTVPVAKLSHWTCILHAPIVFSVPDARRRGERGRDHKPILVIFIVPDARRRHRR